jgi:hypothetical protein
MVEKKSACGCGCIPLKQPTKATKDEKKPKESKEEQLESLVASEEGSIHLPSLLTPQS